MANISTRIKNELMPLALFLGALIVFPIISLLGIVYNFGKSIYHCLRLNPLKAIASFFLYWLRLLYQVWNVVKYGLLHMAIALDLFGNAAGGEMLEDCVTAKEDTLYGKGDFTISAATGKLELGKDLNKTGTWFTWMLTKALGQGHSVNAYLDEVKKDSPIV